MRSYPNTKSILLLSLVLSVACQNNSDSKSPTSEEFTKSFNWLEGVWHRTNSDPGQRDVESWKYDNGFLKGEGCSIEDGDTIFVESLAIKQYNDSIAYEVSGVHDFTVKFWFEEKSDSSFLALCPENEFPKRIEYRLIGDTLIAKVSDAEHSISFKYVKIL